MLVVISKLEQFVLFLFSIFPFSLLFLLTGFIRINTAALGDSDTYVEVLDGSRIHPEAYDWAKKMAVDALEMDEDEGNPANALEEILQGPAKLHELNLKTTRSDQIHMWNKLSRVFYKQLNSGWDCIFFCEFQAQNCLAIA